MTKKTKVIDMKWMAFGRKMFLVKELWFTMHLILFMVTHFANVDGCSIAVFDNLKMVLSVCVSLSLSIIYIIYIMCVCVCVHSIQVLAACAVMTLGMGIYMIVRQV